MLFNSLQYLFFFPIVTSAYFLLPHRWRWGFLLFASYYFYMSWVPSYAALMLVSTLLTYIAALVIGAAKTHAAKKAALAGCLAINLGILGVFKYYGFFAESLRAALGNLHISGCDVPALNVLLPVGISFYTFQSIGYVIDVYRGRLKPERHFGHYALFVSYFPQLVAGPIERSVNLLPQLKEKFYFDYDRVTDGLKLMAWGFFLKCVVADNLAVFVNGVYSKPEAHNGPTLMLATYFFAFQIFCDFAGYTEIAIGTARIMGHDLMENFERPYFAKSIPEFWRRWHISLSTWFRDYLYIPIGGNRASLPRWCANLVFVFVVCGLWHGAAWTFVIWGLLHGVYMAVSVSTRKARTRIEGRMGLDQGGLPVRLAKIFITFNLVCFGWIFFRANSLTDAWYVVTHLSSGLGQGLTAEVNPARLALDVMLVGFLLAVHTVQRKVVVRDYIVRQPMQLRWAGYALLVTAILFLGQFEGADFIYFQF